MTAPESSRAHEPHRPPGMKPATRFAYVDSARGVAAALVVWQHTSDLFVTLAPAVSHAWMAEIADTVDFGRMGVIVFFAISGYVIPNSLHSNGADVGRTFLTRRFFRLFPAYWLSIPVGLATLWAPIGRSLPLSDILLNLTMVPSFLGATEVIGLYWTLALELIFYALCLVLWRLRLLERRWTMVVLLHLTLVGAAGFIGAAIVTHHGASGAWGMICLCFGAMFAGAAWRRWQDGAMVDPLERAAGLAGLVAWLAGLPLASAGVLLLIEVPNKFFITAPSSNAGGLLIFLLMTTVARVEWRPLAWVGVVSYSLYLFHPVVLYPLHRAFQALAPHRVDLALLMALEFVLAIGLAAAVFYTVERPAIALGRRLSGQGRAAPLSPAQDVV